MKKEMISVLETGDIVLFQVREGEFKSNIGMILKRKESGNYVVLSSHNATYKNIHPSWITTINDVETVRNEIITYYEQKIKVLQNQIRKPTQEEKESEKVKKYNELKKQILTTADNLINSKDDYDFENKLKAITNLKREIFSIELECVSDIRKENGRVKGMIKEMEKIKYNLLKNISEEKIKIAFNFE